MKTLLATAVSILFVVGAFNARAEETTGQRIKEDAKEAAHVVKEDAVKAGRAIKKGAVEVGHAAAKGAKTVAKTVKKGAVAAKRKAAEVRAEGASKPHAKPAQE